MRIKTIVVILSLGALCGASACSRDVEKAKREYVARGDRYVEEKNLEAAIIEYRNAIQQDATFGEAYHKLAAAYVTKGDAAEALRAAVTAADLLPENDDAQIEAGGLQLLAGKFPEAKARAEKVLARQTNSVRARVLLGNATAGLKDIDTAIKEFEEAIRLDPQQSGIYTGLAVLKASAGAKDEAERIFKQAIGADPKSVTARLALAQFYWSADRVADAEQVLKEAVGVDPHSVQANVTLAIFYQAIRRAPEAEPYLRAAVDSGKDPRLSMLLADFYITRNRGAEAATILQPLATDKRYGALASMRLAGIAQVQGRPQDALNLIDQSLTLQPKNAVTLAAKSELLRQQNNLDEASKVADAAVAANPRSAQAQFARGRVLQAKGSYDKAEEAFNEVLKINPRVAAARVELAKLRVHERADDAVTVAAEATRADPKSLEAQLTLARALMQKRDLVKAQAVLDDLPPAAANVAAVHSQRGTLFALKQETPAARVAYTRALELDPSHTEALAGLTALDFAAGHQADAVARLEAAVSKSPKNVDLLLLTAGAHVSTKNFARTEQLLLTAIETDPTSQKAYAMLGRTYLVQKKLDAARSQFEKIAARDAKPVVALTLIGTIDMLQNRSADAQKTFEKVLAIDPKAGVAANNLAWLYLENNGSTDMALHLAEVAKVALPRSAEVLDTLGWAYYKKDRIPAAITELRRSSELDPKNATTMYHLALAYERSGDRQAARDAMSRYLQLDPSSDRSADVRRRLQSLGT